MYLGVAVLKLMSNESESAKKICTFLDYFFFVESWCICICGCQDRVNLIKKFKKKYLVYVIFILKFTLHNLEASPKGHFLEKP